MENETLLKHLKQHSEEHEELLSENKKLINEQTDYLKATIEEYKPIMEYYHSKFIFTHPDLNYQSSKGPVLNRR